MGNIVHAKTAHSFGEEAFINIMSWQTGKTTFNPDVPPREKTIFIPTENLLLNWSYKKQEWEKIRNLVPSPHAIFRLSLQNDTEDKSVKGDHWNVLALADGNRSVLEIARTLGWDEFKTSKVICQLIQEGLLEKGRGKDAPSKKFLEEDFFQMVQNELRKILGPVAPFIIDDQLIEFGKAKNYFPQNQALSFIEALSEDIPNDQKKKEFKRAMMEFLSLEK
jgi:DNA-binding MarR family transcriptional regulator